MTSQSLHFPFTSLLFLPLSSRYDATCHQGSVAPGRTLSGRNGGDSIGVLQCLLKRVEEEETTSRGPSFGRSTYERPGGRRSTARVERRSG